MTQAQDKLSTKTKVLFSWPDVYGGGVMNIVNFFYAIFLTDVCRIDPRWAGLIMLVARFWDAVTDPAMGLISDNTRSRMGRRKPYFAVGVPLIFLSFVILWNPVGFSAEGLRVAYAMGAYVFLNTVTTLVMVPYQAMAAELTLDYNERASIATTRMIFSFGSTLVCALMPSYIINAFADIRTGYIVMAACFGLFFAVPWAFMVRGVHENPAFMNTPRVKLQDALKALAAPFRVRSFRLFIPMYLGVFMTLDIVSMLFSYFMTYHIGRPDLLSIVLGLLVVCQLLFLPVVSACMKRLGKAPTFSIGCVLWVVFCLVTWLLQPGQPVVFVFLLAAGMGFSIAFPMVAVHAAFGDVTDAGELIIGRRAEGSFSGVQTFLRKCAAAGSNALALLLLDRCGYLKPLVELVDGASKNIPQAQPAAVLLAIRSLIAFAPLVLLAVSILAARRYPLSFGLHARLVAYLQLKRSGQPASEEEGEDLRAQV